MALSTDVPLGPRWSLEALIARGRFAEATQREVVGILEDVFREIASVLRNADDFVGRTQRLQLEAVFSQVRALLTEAYGTVDARISPVFREYFSLELEVAKRQGLAVAAIKAGRLEGAVAGFAGGSFAQPAVVDAFMQGITRQLVVAAARLPEIVQHITVGGVGFGDYWTQARETSVLRVRRVIQNAVVQGLHPRDIAREVYATKDTPGLNAWRGTKRDAITSVRTLVTAVQNEAQQIGHEQFDNVIEEVMFEAVIDARTCLPADALIETPHGSRAIASLQKGDTVIGGTGAHRRILATQRSVSKQIAIVHLSNGGIIRCTPDHLFLTKDGHWVEARHLTKFDDLAQPGDQR